MADSFADHLRAQLDGIQAELDRLEAKRRLIEQLLSLESRSAAASGSSAASASARRAPRRSAPAAKGRRRPRGLITGKVREFLAQQREPVHGTEILAYLERQDAAPQSAKPMATLQSTLQRLQDLGEIENTGRNRWRLRGADQTEVAAAAPPLTASETLASPTSQAAAPASAAPRAGAGPPVVTSTTTFGSSPSAGL